MLENAVQVRCDGLRIESVNVTNRWHWSRQRRLAYFQREHLRLRW